MEKEVFCRGFCYYDYVYYNILIDDNRNINVIDFDYCILDLYLYDLLLFLIRIMKDDKWEKEKVDLILNFYRKVMEVKNYEILIIREFIRFL